MNNKEIPNSIKKFNWGAFFCLWIWGIKYRSYKTFWYFLGLPFALVPHIGWLIPISMAIWFGIDGNKWAWQNNAWESEEQFSNEQKNWIKWYFVYLAIIAYFIIYIAGIIAYLGASITDSFRYPYY